MIDLIQTGEMTPTEWLIALGALACLFFFLLAQHRILLAVRPDNRRLIPVLVWLQVIPLFGQIWQFFVVFRIAKSLRKEKLSRLEESLMNNTLPPVLPAANYPTLAMGLSYCIFTAIYVLADLYALLRPASTSISIDRAYHPDIDFYMVTLVPLGSIFGALLCWILYWVSLVRIRRRLVAVAP
jgi:hypothetical protein